MRTYLPAAAAFFFFLLAMIIVPPAQAQKMDEAAVKDLVASRSFSFVPQTVFPQGGPSRPVTSDYRLLVTPDTLMNDLPYFGRAYTAILPGEGGIRFTSVTFSYTVKPAKKGGWNITILPQDTKDVRELNLSVSRNGYASLQVTSNNRQAISYYGYLTGKR